MSSKPKRRHRLSSRQRSLSHTSSENEETVLDERRQRGKHRLGSSRKYKENGEKVRQNSGNDYKTLQEKEEDFLKSKTKLKTKKDKKHQKIRDDREHSKRQKLNDDSESDQSDKEVVKKDDDDDDDSRSEMKERKRHRGYKTTESRETVDSGRKEHDRRHKDFEGERYYSNEHRTSHRRYYDAVQESAERDSGRSRKHYEGSLESDRDKRDRRKNTHGERHDRRKDDGRNLNEKLVKADDVRNMVVGSRYYQHLEKDETSSRKPKRKSPEQEAKNDAKPENELPKKKFDPISSKTGGAYIPPAMLKLMQASITDKSSVEYQRISWEALKKSIHGLINKVNRSNIDKIIRQLLKENIVRGRGLLTRSIAQAQAMSVTFTCVYAALAALINSRFPNVGELLLKRLVIQFRRGFKRNDKASCIAAVSFVAHLVNQRVAHEILALEILTLLVETPTNDSIEVAIAFLKECGMKLTEVSKKGIDAIFEMLRNVLHEGKVDERVKHMIEVMFQVRKDKFKDNEAIPDGLDLVEEEDQFTHLITLDDATDGEDILNVFKFDPDYLAHEEKYKELSKEMVGDSDESEGGEDDSGKEDDDDEEEEEDEDENEPDKQIIVDNTETNLIALRRTIYLAIYSSLDFEECAHKLMRMQLKPGQEPEVCAMILDCCCEMRTYERFYGLLAQRFCQVNRTYIPPFESLFKDTYSTVHRLKTNQCRNVAKLFAHLLFTDAISWDVLSCIRLNEEDTTSSGRIFIKILFHELSEYMGLVKLNDRVKDPTLQNAFTGLFPRDNPRNTRFSINFFTSIGLGGLTDELREHLKVAIQTESALLPVAAAQSSPSSSSSSSDDDDDVSSGSSDDSNLLVSSDSDSDSSDDGREKKRKSKGKERKVKKRKESERSEKEIRRNMRGRSPPRKLSKRNK